MRAKLPLTGVLLVFVVFAAASCGPSPTVASATPGYSQTDIRPGAGNEAAAGSVVTVEYAGWLLDPTQADQKGLLFDTSRGGPPPVPAGTRGAPGCSLLSLGSADASLTCVSRPVFWSSDRVVTTAVSSFSR